MLVSTRKKITLIMIVSIIFNAYTLENNKTVEGEHFFWILKEKSTDKIPELALNSSWSIVKPNINGIIKKDEWKDATEISLDSKISNSIEGEPTFIGRLFIKNDVDFLYLAFDIKADRSNNQDTLSIYSIPDADFKIFCSTEQNTIFNQLEVRFREGFTTNRVWEIQISRSKFFEYEIFPFRIEITDNEEYNSVNYEWPLIGHRNLALSLSSKQNVHNSATYKTYIKEMIQVLDQSYELLQDLYGNTPFSGEKINFIVDYSLEYGGLSGNPIQIKNPYSIDTCLHELGHVFTYGFWDVRALSESLAEISTLYLYLNNLKSSNVYIDTHLNTYNVSNFLSRSNEVLLEYEQNDQKYDEIDILTEEYQPQYQSIEVFNGIFSFLIDYYGWEIFSRFSDPSSPFNDIPKLSQPKKMMNLLVYRLSLGAKEDLRSLFRDRWRMPVFEINSYLLKEINKEIKIELNTDAVIDISSFRYYENNSSFTYDIIGQTNQNNYCNLTFPLKLLSGPFQIKINKRTLSTDHIAFTNQSHAFISFNTNHSYNKIQLLGTYSDFEPPQTTHNYNGSIREQNFTIQLNAIDYSSGVSEILYRINNGSIKKISEEGHPFITEEGYNTLEYWSIDKVNNEEPHNLLRDIIISRNIPKEGETIQGVYEGISIFYLIQIMCTILIGFLLVEILINTST